MAGQASYTVRTSGSHARTLGITERATPLGVAWTGELRVRFSDFQVNEIQEDGTVVHLKTVGLGEEKKAPEVKQQKEAVVSSEKPAQTASNGETKDAEEQTASKSDAQTEARIIPEVPAEDVAALEALVGERFAKEVVEMYKSPPADHEKKKTATSDPLDDRSKRGQIHQEIRRIFKSRIETNTDDQGAIIATIMPQRGSGGKKRSRGNRDRRERDRDEKPTGDYVRFTLYKENRDTMDAINQIARFLKVKPQVIGYAGTKDRRATTTQRCSVRYTRPRNLAGINGKLWGVSTGDYEYSDRPIHLGGLLGNEFVITIKNCQMAGQDMATPIAEQVEKLQANAASAINHMFEHGWINYFGHQRFGTHDIGTHEIGKLILGDKYEEAVKAILHYDEAVAAKAESEDIPEEASKRDDLYRNLACKLFLTGDEKDVARARELLPRRFTAEQSIFRHLDRSGAQSRKDFVGALIHITRGLRSMYLHAYQSYVWNHAASHRWTLHGATVVEGDLVIAADTTAPAANDQEDPDDDIVHPVPDDDDEDAPLRARALTAEEAASGAYTIHDVVLPTPGYDVVYPTNALGSFYTSFMAQPCNGALDPHAMRRMRREFSLPGRYRKLTNRFLAAPSVAARAYADDTEQMHPTDLDVLGGQSEEEEPARKKVRVEEGEKVAVVVRFQLGRSAYATVALRELMGDPSEETS